MQDQRMILLNRWAQQIAQAAQAGALDKSKPMNLMSIETVCGPRAGALEIHAGFDTGRLLKVMSENDFALHRQFVPWAFTGEPSVYLSSRFVRLEAAWPESLAEKNIALRSLAPYPRGSAYWIAGKCETGETVALSLSDTVPHFLFGGHTGSGKTVAMRSMIAQLAANTGNQFVLVDGKYGNGLGLFNRLRGLVAPVAIDITTARAALAWCVTEMRRRYETGDKNVRLIIVIDEIQEFTGTAGDPFTTEMLRRLVVQGRGVNMHVIVGTQHPTIEAAFTDSNIRSNLVGRVALRVENYKSSEVVVGGPNPRADHLCGAGDSYCIVPGVVRRVQMAYVPENEIARLDQAAPILDAYPEPAPDAAGTLESVGWQYTAEELGIAIINGHAGGGRPALTRALEEAGLPKPGSGRAARLLALGRETYAWLTEHGWSLTHLSD